MGYETGRAGDAADLEDHVEPDQLFSESRQRNRGRRRGRGRAQHCAVLRVCVCATDRFDRGRVCDDVRDERCSRGVFRCRGGENGSCRRRCVCHSFSRKLCEKQNISPPLHSAHTTRLEHPLSRTSPTQPSLMQAHKIRSTHRLVSATTPRPVWPLALYATSYAAVKESGRISSISCLTVS